MKPEKLQKVIAQMAASDPHFVVACDLALLADCLVRAGEVNPTAAAAAADRAGKIAVIGVQGALTPNGSWFGTSLNSIGANVSRAAADSDVAAIVLNVDSPGGTVAGTMEAAQAVKDASAQKPVIAIANTLAGSAAYWIASQAGELVMAPSADVGSIGAMVMHQDVSKMLETYGVNITLIRSEQSPLKNEAHPFAPLSDQAREFLQGRANEAGADFIKAVAGGRKTTQTNVRENFGQGRMYGAREAVSRGMADRVATLDQVIGGLVQKFSAAARPMRRRSALAFD